MEVASSSKSPIRRLLARKSWQRIPPYALLAGVLLIAIAPRFVFDQQSEWRDVYVDAARLLRAGQPLYQAGHPYVYPPFMAAAAVPFTYLPEQGSRVLWLLINAVALVVCIRSAWRIAGGGENLPNWESPRSEHWIVWLGLACGGYYVIDALSHQQPDLAIAALVLRGCLAVREDQSLLGGLLLGIAAGCKCTPLLFAPYLVWRSRWLAVAIMLATAIGINLIPDLIHPPAGSSWLIEWWKTYIAPQVRGDALPGVWASDVIYNQSLAGALNRWTQTTWQWDAQGVIVAPASAAMSTSDLKQLVRGLQLVILLFVAVVFLHRPFTPIAEPTSEANERRFANECGLILVLMLLFSPMSSKPHFCTLLLPGFCIARALVNAKRRMFLGGLLGCAILCGLLANKDLVKARIYTLVLWYGLVTISAILLGMGCWMILWQNRDAQAAAGGSAQQTQSTTNQRAAA